MKTPRRRITFKTPRKRQTPSVKSSARKTKLGVVHAKKMPYTEKEGPEKKELSEDSANSTALDEVNILIGEKEKDGIEVYRSENKYLRELKSDAILFKKFTGIEILEKSGKYMVKQSITGRDGVKMLKFELREDEDTYLYKLADTNCTDLPEFLKEDISFESKEIHKFFFKVFEVLISKNA